MRPHLAFWCAGMIGVLASPAAEAAQAAKFGLKQIIINGSTNVKVTAINDHGGMVGFADVQGFVADGTDVTLLPPLIAGCTLCTVYPTAINAKGDVTGTFQISSPAN